MTQSVVFREKTPAVHRSDLVLNIQQSQVIIDWIQNRNAKK